MEVLQFRGRTGTYLEHAPGAASLNLLKMAREGLMLDLRTVVSKAIKQNTRIRQPGVRIKLNGHTVEIAIAGSSHQPFEIGTVRLVFQDEEEER